ncbi:hypothetical protein N9Z65_01045 [bacterium]|nr:hypothetical protein [bacterium]
MPDIEIVKLKLRRGTDTQRQSVTLEQGELGYTTDGKRVWVGDGFTIGGNTVGNIGHITAGTRTDLTNAVVGDIVYEDNFLYQLSATDVSDTTSWKFIGTSSDDTMLDYDSNNKLHIVDNGVGIAQLSSNVVKNNGGLTFASDGISANVDNSTIAVESTTGQLSVIGDYLTLSNVGNGLSGGGNDPLGVYTTDSFAFDGTRLSFVDAPLDTVDAESIVSSALGTGLEKNDDGTQIRLANTPNGAGTASPFNTTSYDEKGRITLSVDTIEQNLSGSGAGNIFFGSLNEANPGSEEIYSALSANSDQSLAVTIQLSSAGFIQIASGSNGNFAIPVFKF